MSAEATVAVMEHADQLGHSDWRMLMLLANEANAHGVTTGVSMDALAKRMGIKDRAAAGVKNRLKDAGLLVVLDEGGGRGRTAVYWIKLPGLAGPEKTPQIHVGTPQPQTVNQTDTPQPDAPNGADRSISSSTTSSSSSKEAKEKEFITTVTGFVDPDIEGEGEVIEDGLGLLRAGKKVGGKIVTPVEMAIAAACITAFNREFEWKGKRGSDYGLGANLTSIVERARERTSWDVTKHVRLVESAWRVRWWEQNGRSDRRPHPNVIWGGKSFDNVIQDARDEAGGEKVEQIRKRRYTRG